LIGIGAEIGLSLGLKAVTTLPITNNMLRGRYEMGNHKDEQNRLLTVAKVIASLETLADNLANLGEEAAATNIRLANQHLQSSAMKRPTRHLMAD
jgi:hypothetical protein